MSISGPCFRVTQNSHYEMNSESFSGLMTSKSRFARLPLLRVCFSCAFAPCARLFLRIPPACLLLPRVCSSHAFAPPPARLLPARLVFPLLPRLCSPPALLHLPRCICVWLWILNQPIINGVGQWRILTANQMGTRGRCQAFFYRGVRFEYIHWQYSLHVHYMYSQYITLYSQYINTQFSIREYFMFIVNKTSTLSPCVHIVFSSYGSYIFN
jgi:hypothetical protein